MFTISDSGIRLIHAFEVRINIATTFAVPK